MQEYYIVTSTGIKDGKPYSSLSRVIQGEKENGDKYSFFDSKAFPMRENEEMPLGTVLLYETARRVEPTKGNR